MYAGTRRYQRRQRKRAEIRGYVRTLVWVLTVICILVIAAAMAVQTNASKVVAAEAETVVSEPVVIDESKVIDVAQAVTADSRCAAAAVVKSAKAEADRAIVIDPGHGGMDGGCVFEGIVEKDINLQIALLVKDKLQEKGYRVMLARKGDELLDKADRVEEANRQNARLYVSIHQNSCEDGSVSGIETWYDDADATGEGRRLARLIQQETVRTTGASDRELVSDPDMCVTSKSKMPACLIETGFLSNRAERKKLDTPEYQEKVAEGIANGIDLYLNPKIMYLTFDDGPSEEYTDQVLDVLKQKNIKATFFLIGEYVRKYPETAKRIADEGHTIGIHCDVHDYHKIYADVSSYVEDFEKAYDTVYEVTGARAQLFRFPGGSINAYNRKVYQDIIEEMESRGFIYYDWNASLEDATAAGASSQQLIRTAVDTTLGRRQVVMLAHDRIEVTANALGDLIDAFPEYRMEALTAEAEPVHF